MIRGVPPGAEGGRGAVLGALGLAALANWAQFAVWLLVPFYLVNVLGLSAALGGIFFMLTPLGTAVLAPLAGRLTDRVGPRAPLTHGLALPAAFYPVVFALSFLVGVAEPLRAAAIQRLAADEVRAQAASAASACDKALLIIGLPAAGAWRRRQ